MPNTGALVGAGVKVRVAVGRSVKVGVGDVKWVWVSAAIAVGVGIRVGVAVGGKRHQGWRDAVAGTVKGRMLVHCHCQSGVKGARVGTVEDAVGVN